MENYYRELVGDELKKFEEQVYPIFNDDNTVEVVTVGKMRKPVMEPEYPGFAIILNVHHEY